MAERHDGCADYGAGGWSVGGDVQVLQPAAAHGFLEGWIRVILFGVGVKVRDAIKRIETAGWRLKRTRGDHRVYVHGTKPGIVVVPGHLGADLAVGTLTSILRQAGMK